MDERHLARLVDEVERTFPGDLAAQREAWEFLESFMEAADAVEAAPSPADATGDEPAAVRRLLAACRELLRDTSGRIAGAVEQLVPPQPAVLMGNEEEPGTEVHLDADAATEVGVDPAVAVELTLESVTLVARRHEWSAPERLAAVLQVPGGTGDDESVIVQRFTTQGPEVAMALFDIAADRAAAPLGLAFVLFDA